VIGILGGTFDPIHLAHLRIAEEAREALALSRVLFVPAGDPPWKHGLAAPFRDRLEMVRLATAPNAAFEASELEGARSGPSYTVDTLRELTRRLPGSRLWFILGADAFAGIASWHQAQALFGLAAFCVFARPGFEVSRPPVGCEVRVLRGTALEISASDIRARAARGASLRYLVPDAVIDYIEKHRLYREDH
jgi:nicotinate-nucleotide adenylyltransferase